VNNDVSVDVDVDVNDDERTNGDDQDLIGTVER
jgi:hypothetical protein